MENNNIQSNNHGGETLFQQSVSFSDLFDSVLKYWYWFAISIFVFLCIGGVYLMSKSPVYQREAAILVKDARRGGAASELAAFADIAGMSTRRSVDNELYVLQARRLMVEVVERLGLTVNYSTKSLLRTTTLYRNSPIEVTFVDNLGGKPCSFLVTLGAEEFVLNEFVRSKSDGGDPDIDELFTVKAPYGEEVSLPIGTIIVNKTLYFDPETSLEQEIKVSKSTKEAVATAYRSRVKSSVPSKMSSIINLSLSDVVPQRAEDVLNTLIEVYNDDAVDD